MEKYTLFFINICFGNERKKSKIDGTVIFPILKKSANNKKNYMYLSIDMNK